MSKLHAAIAASGGTNKVAAALGISAPRLSNWLSRGVPAEQCPALERVTNGAVRCEDLRPDVDWAFLRGNAAIEKAAA